jgi:hypothetical protein
LLLAGNDDLMLLWVRFVSGLLLLLSDEFWLLVAFNAKLLLSVLHDAGLMLIVTCYNRAKFLYRIICCAVASGELFMPAMLCYWWRSIMGCCY